MSVGGALRRRGESQPEIPAELVRTLLSMLRQRLGLDAAWVSSCRDGRQIVDVVDGTTDTLGLSPGHSCALTDSYSARVLDGRLPAVIPDTVAHGVAAALTGPAASLRALIGVPVLSPSGTATGMVCVVSEEPKPYLGDDDRRLVQQVADLIGTLIESPLRRADSADQRHAIRRVVAEQDFVVVFQAVHDVADGRVVGVEALARFPCEPFRPDAFFEQAAQLGLGIELETAIVRRVLSLLPTLPDDAFVAINMSPSAALAAPWDELLADVDASRLVLELTEHDAVKNYAALDEALESCRARGVRVAVDDVGAGFASFSHVLELGPEFVKIDRSITRHIDTDDARRRLAQAIAQFAGQIGATVIAEGVETQPELDAVSAAGITSAQGYLLSRPTNHSHGFPGATATAAPADPQQPASVDLLGDRRFELALAHSPIGMAVVDLDGRFLRTNRALRAMFGYSRRTMDAMTFQDITHPDDLNADLALVNECLQGKRRSFRMDKRYIAADGHVVWCALTAVLVHAPRNRPKCFVSQIVDVTSDRVREAETERRAETDPLTAIANRSAAWARLEKLRVRGAGYGVLLCDIVRFRAVNDQRGHHAGDQLLVEVATRLLGTVESDELVARWGGDQFLVVTDSAEDHILEMLADRIADQFAGAPVTLGDGSEIPVALTVGYASHRSGDDRSIDAVLDRASRAVKDRRRRPRLVRRRYGAGRRG